MIFLLLYLFILFCCLNGDIYLSIHLRIYQYLMSTTQFARGHSIIYRQVRLSARCSMPPRPKKENFRKSITLLFSIRPPSVPIIQRLFDNMHDDVQFGWCSAMPHYILSRSLALYFFAIC